LEIILARRASNEQATVTFHVIEKGVFDEDGEFTPSKFTSDEFISLKEKITNQENPDLNDPTDLELVRKGKVIPFSNIEEDSGRIMTGTFEGAYSGHAFKNSDYGKIHAKSVNQRLFCFLIYHSENGRIYVGAQYLGLYGAYTDLKDTLLRFISLPKNTRVRSIRMDAEEFANSTPLELRLTLKRPASEAGAEPKLGSAGALSFRRVPGSETFEVTVKDKLLAFLGNPAAKMKQQIAAIVSESELYEINEDDIENCSVIVRAGKSEKIIYLLGENSTATRFLLDVPFESIDGLPKTPETKKQMLKILKEKVLSKNPNE
jgi:hypothetical protein